MDHQALPWELCSHLRGSSSLALLCGHAGHPGGLHLAPSRPVTTTVLSGEPRSPWVLPAPWSGTFAVS